MFTILFLSLLSLLSIYDLRFKKIPNWITLPLIGSGLILYFPGSFAHWFITIGLCLVWQAGALGGGDAKLWIATFWLLAPDASLPTMLALAATFLLTGALQLLLRRLRGQITLGIKSPGAWRTIPFALWIVFAP